MKFIRCNILIVTYLIIVSFNCNVTPLLLRCEKCSNFKKSHNILNENKKLVITLRFELSPSSGGRIINLGGFNVQKPPIKYLNILKNAIKKEAPNVIFDIQCIADLKTIINHYKYVEWKEYCGIIIDLENLPYTDYYARVTHRDSTSSGNFQKSSIPFIISFGLIPFFESKYHIIEFEIFKPNELPLYKYKYKRKILFYSMNWLPLIITFMQFSSKDIIDPEIWTEVTSSIASELQSDIEK